MRILPLVLAALAAVLAGSRDATAAAYMTAPVDVVGQSCESPYPQEGAGSFEVWNVPNDLLLSVTCSGKVWIPGRKELIFGNNLSPLTSAFHITVRETPYAAQTVVMELTTVQALCIQINNAASTGQKAALCIPNTKDTPEVHIQGRLFVNGKEVIP